MANPIPLLDFQPYNPIQTALDAYLKTSQGISQNRANNENAKLNRQKADVYGDLTQAQIEHMKSQNERNAVLNAQGPRVGVGIAGQEDAYHRYMQAAKEAEASGDMERATQLKMSAERIAKGVVATTNAKITPGMRAWGDLSTPERDQYVGIAKAMGVPANEASMLGMNGVTLEEIADSRGIPREKLASLHAQNAPTTTTRDRSADRIGREAESKVLNDFIVPAISKYLGPEVDILGFSPKQLNDTLKGMNKEDQANLIAAYKIQMDLAANQLKLGAGIAGIQAIREQMKHSITELKPMLPNADPEVWRMAQFRANDVLSHGARAYTKAAENYGQVLNQEEKGLVDSVANDMKGNNYSSMTDAELDAEIARLQAGGK